MEFVYAIDRDDLFDLRYPQGFYSVAGEASDEVSTFHARARSEGYFLQRRRAEQTSSVKQIIPYLLICRNDQLLEVERLEEQSEERLHSLFSIGLGGHLNPEDEEPSDLSLFEAGIQRELTEELHISSDYSTTFVGIVNDDSNDVGSVHFGLTYRIDTGDAGVEIRETENMNGTFRSPDELRRRRNDMPDRFESWSRLIIDDLSGATSV